MTIIEFPAPLEAARDCLQLNMKVLMGAPNVVRGGSHWGNVAAAGLLDILSSNYFPASLARSREGSQVVQQVWRQAKRVF